MITRFDNGGRLTTLRRKAEGAGEMQKSRRVSLSQAREI